ncbi:MAG: hypothetical protein JSR59_20885 [Proteobacteria bacterium]|nr:hypothetical protein [Pseudomonadota bacterium]
MSIQAALAESGAALDRGDHNAGTEAAQRALDLAMAQGESDLAARARCDLALHLLRQATTSKPPRWACPRCPSWTGVSALSAFDRFPWQCSFGYVISHRTLARFLTDA